MDPQPHRRNPRNLHDTPPPETEFRQSATPPPTPPPPPTKRTQRRRLEDAESETGISLLDILRILGGLLLLSSALSYFITRESLFWNYRPSITRPGVLKAWLVRLLSSATFPSAFPCHRPITQHPPTSPSSPALLQLQYPAVVLIQLSL